MFSGKSEYRSLADFANRHPFFVKFREKQKEIADHRAPCLLMDHPEMLREICARAPWYAADNMPKGYLDGDIGRAMDACATSWRQALRGLERIPECVRRDMDATRRTGRVRNALQAARIGDCGGSLRAKVFAFRLALLRIT